MSFNLNGYIVDSPTTKEFYSLFGLNAICPIDVENWLKSDDKDRTIYFDSFGGDVFAGSKIYTAIHEAGDITGIISSIAASAASFVAMGCKVLKISPTAQIMIHNVSTSADGDYRDMEHTAEELKTANQSLKNAYRFKTNLSDEELQIFMDAETWFEAYRAKKLGFVDEIMFAKDEETIDEKQAGVIAKRARLMFAAVKSPNITAIKEALSAGKQSAIPDKNPKPLFNNELFLMQLKQNQNYLGGL